MNEVIVATPDPHKELDSTDETQTGIDSFSDMTVEGTGGDKGENGKREEENRGRESTNHRNTHTAFTQDAWL